MGFGLLISRTDERDFRTNSGYVTIPCDVSSVFGQVKVPYVQSSACDEVLVMLGTLRSLIRFSSR